MTKMKTEKREMRKKKRRKERIASSDGGRCSNVLFLFLFFSDIHVSHYATGIYIKDIQNKQFNKLTRGIYLT